MIIGVYFICVRVYMKCYNNGGSCCLIYQESYVKIYNDGLLEKKIFVVFSY